MIDMDKSVYVQIKCIKIIINFDMFLSCSTIQTTNLCRFALIWLPSGFIFIHFLDLEIGKTDSPCIEMYKKDYSLMFLY